MTASSGDKRVQVEIERKFDADPSVVVPPLDGLAGVAGLADPAEHDLAATYFDTGDLRLARAGITLRRRTGGADDGWHLKLPTAADERLEIRRPLGRAVRTVPRELAGLVQSHVRDQRLAAVATVTTHRTVRRLLDERGELLAEVADDLVRGETTADPGGRQSWREIEVELGSGDRSLLAAVGEALLSAGAVPGRSASKVGRVLGVSATDVPAGRLSRSTPTGDVVRQHLAEQVAALLAYDPRARQDLPDAVHKMRVASRRLRSALATFRPVLDREHTDPLRAELKWLGQVLGGPRDAEVMMARLDDLVRHEPPDLVLGPVRRRIDLELRQQHRDAHANLVRELGTARYFNLLDGLDELLERLPLIGKADERADRVLPGLVARTRKGVLRLATEVDGERSPERREVLLHEVRKAAKRSRYAAEAVTPALGRKAEKFAARMEHLQEVLGEHQDSAVTRAALREIAGRAFLAGENGFTFGRLHGLEQARADRIEHEYVDVLAAIRSDVPRWLR